MALRDRRSREFKAQPARKAREDEAPKSADAAAYLRRQEKLHTYMPDDNKIVVGFSGVRHMHADYVTEKQRAAGCLWWEEEHAGICEMVTDKARRRLDRDAAAGPAQIGRAHV